MPFTRGGRRTNYDNIAVGSAWLSAERVIGQSTSDLAAVSDPSLWSKMEVSLPGNAFENAGVGVGGGTVNNIAVAAVPGIEDTESGTGDKLTSDNEDISDAG